MNNTISKSLEDFYQGDVPQYVRKAGKTFLTIRASMWEGAEPHEIKIRLQDCLRYYAVDARNITSGCRSIAGFTTDWRTIDAIAKEALEWFKQVNVKALRALCKQYGMTARF